MSVRSAQSVTVSFTTQRFDTGAATNADSTPTGTLVVNGTDNGASVTVTNVDAGRYKAAVTLPTLAIGDIVELSIAATVNSVVGKAIIWRDTKDVLLDSNGAVTNNDKTGYALTSSYDFAKGTVAVTESYNADGAAPTPVQALMVIMQMLTETSIAGTTTTVKKLDGSTTALTLTLDSATLPTSCTRAT